MLNLKQNFCQTINMGKLALGTAQFGMDYGVNNPRGKVPFPEVSKILHLASSYKIDLLDTAYLYGESEKVIGRCLTNTGLSFKLVSKLPSVESRVEAENYLSQSLKRLGVKNLYGYLIHNFENFRQNLWLWDFLHSLKIKGLVKKVGFSLYFPEEIEFLWAQDFLPDLLQVPFSIFDQRFRPWFQELKRSEIEIHTRSVFLQGLVFKDPETLPPNFGPFSQRIKELREMARKNDLPYEALFLGFAIENPYVDYVVVGVDSSCQLREIIKALKYRKEIKEKFLDVFSSFALTDPEIVLPFRWKF